MPPSKYFGVTTMHTFLIRNYGQALPLKVANTFKIIRVQICTIVAKKIQNKFPRKHIERNEI